jgi:hypothetical protein
MAKATRGRPADHRRARAVAAVPAAVPVAVPAAGPAAVPAVAPAAVPAVAPAAAPPVAISVNNSHSGGGAVVAGEIMSDIR